MSTKKINQNEINLDYSQDYSNANFTPYYNNAAYFETLLQYIPVGVVVGYTPSNILSVDTVKGNGITVEVTCSKPHHLLGGESVNMTGWAASISGNFNGVHVITLISSNKFSYLATGQIDGFGGIAKVTVLSISQANATLADYGFVICNGTEYYNSTSPIYNIAGRYLPHLTDERFLRGFTAAGSDGSNDKGTVTASGALTLQDTVKGWGINTWVGYYVHVVSVLGTTQTRRVVSNTANTLTLNTAWTINPSVSDIYVIGGGSNFLGDHTHTHHLVTALTVYYGTGQLTSHNHGNFSSYTSTGQHDHDHYVICSNSYNDHSACLVRDRTLSTSVVIKGAHNLFGIFPFSQHYHDSTSVSVSYNSVPVAHTHNVSFSGSTVGTGATPVLTDNRPRYLSVYFIKKVTQI